LIYCNRRLLIVDGGCMLASSSDTCPRTPNMMTTIATMSTMMSGQRVGEGGGLIICVVVVLVGGRRMDNKDVCCTINRYVD
jgi:hypothetical protein